MEQVYIRLYELKEYDRNLLLKFTNRDLISIDDLLSIIDDLLDQKNHLEEQIEEMKEPIDYEDEPGFDYGEWKMSIDSANGR